MYKDMYTTETTHTYEELESALKKGRDIIPAQTRGGLVFKDKSVYRACALGAIAVGLGWDYTGTWNDDGSEDGYDFLTTHDIPYGLQDVIYKANDGASTGEGDEAALLALKKLLS